MTALSRLMTVAAAAALFIGVAGQVQAADMSLKDEVYAPAPQSIWGPGWMVRFRGLGVIPDEDSGNWTVDGDPVPGADLKIDNSIVPELDISYFFTKNIAVELILGVTPHDIDGAGILSGLNIGDAWLLPPTLTLQYHFDMGAIKPYVGAGINYTVFFGEDAHGGQGFSNLELDNNFGWALQAGVDIQIEGNWFLNVDVKKLWLDTEATVDHAVHGHVKADVDIDPWIIGVGFGYKFGGPEPLPPLK